jgi:hypothetical protein
MANRTPSGEGFFHDKNDPSRGVLGLSQPSLDSEIEGDTFRFSGDLPNFFRTNAYKFLEYCAEHGIEPGSFTYGEKGASAHSKAIRTTTRRNINGISCRRVNSIFNRLYYDSLIKLKAYFESEEQ